MMFLLLLVLGIFIISFGVVWLKKELSKEIYEKRVYTRNLRHER